MRRFNQPFPAENPERVRWLEEEVHELVTALFKNDRLAALDAVIDYYYIAKGGVLENPSLQPIQPISCLCLGVEAEHSEAVLESAWKIVHAANMSKVWTTAERDACTDASIVFTPCGDYKLDDEPLWIGQRNGKVVKPPSWVGPEAALMELLAK